MSVRRIRAVEVARFPGMTVFETDSLEARTMRLLHDTAEDTWYVSELGPEAMAAALAESKG